MRCALVLIGSSFGRIQVYLEQAKLLGEGVDQIGVQMLHGSPVQVGHILQLVLLRRLGVHVL